MATETAEGKCPLASRLRVAPAVFLFHRDIRDVLEQRALFGEVSYDARSASTSR